MINWMNEYQGVIGQHMTLGQASNFTPLLFSTGFHSEATTLPEALAQLNIWESLI